MTRRKPFEHSVRPDTRHPSPDSREAVPDDSPGVHPACEAIYYKKADKYDSEVRDLLQDHARERMQQAGTVEGPTVDTCFDRLLGEGAVREAIWRLQTRGYLPIEVALQFKRGWFTVKPGRFVVRGTDGPVLVTRPSVRSLSKAICEVRFRPLRQPGPEDTKRKNDDSGEDRPIIFRDPASEIR